MRAALCSKFMLDDVEMNLGVPIASGNTADIYARRKNNQII